MTSVILLVATLSTVVTLTLATTILVGVVTTDVTISTKRGVKLLGQGVIGLVLTVGHEADDRHQVGALMLLWQQSRLK